MIKRFIGLKILNTIAFIIMIAVNMFANILPFNNISTAAVSDLYPNLFTPAAYTFFIWSVIYFLLACFIIYQFGNVGGKKNKIIKSICPFFVISSLANAGWMFCWHYNNIIFSFVLMIIILMSLGIIFFKIENTNLSYKESVFIKLPFSVYFGWISVAFIANLIVLLVSFGFNAFNIGGQILTIIVIILGMAAGIMIVFRERNIFYGLVFVWAYIGLLIKHISASGFKGQYLPIIIITFISAAVLIIIEVIVIMRNKTSLL